MPDEEQFITKLLKLREDILNETKRAVKKKVPKTPEIRCQIRDNVVYLFNKITILIRDNWANQNELQKSEAKKHFLYVRDRVVTAFRALNINYLIPRTLGETISSEKIDSEFESEEEATMSLTEFFNLASKILPNEFGGEPHKLQSIIDALTLLKTNVGEYETQAVIYVKTKLTGQARQCVENASSIQQIIETLKTNVKIESSMSVAAKMLDTKQKGKSSESFLSEIESLAIRLQQAYTSEGVPTNTATRYVTDATVKAISQNATSDEIKIIIKAGTFNTPQEVLAKFAIVKPDVSPNNIFSLRGHNFRGRNNHFNNNRRRGRYNHFSNNGRGQFTNFRGSQHTQGTNYQQSGHYRGNNYRGNNRGFYSRRGNYQPNDQNFIRSYEVQQSNSENPNDPQTDCWGEDRSTEQ